MARKIFIRTIQNKNRKNVKAYGKWYGKVVHIGRVNTEQLAEHIMEHGSVYTDDVVIGIVRKMMRCIQELLLDGYKVQLDGIGTLYLSAESQGVNKKEDYSADTHIKALRVRFLGDQSNDSLYSKNGITRAARLTTDFSAFGIAEANSGSGSGSGNDDSNPGGSVVEDEP
jgi:predicted histone-like DNA-binding protein